MIIEITGTLRSLTFGTPAAFRILLLNFFQYILQFEVRIFNGLGTRHDTISHGFIDDLNRVKGSHGSCSEYLVILFANIVSNEFHLFEISDYMEIIPASSDSSKDKRIVELSGPEEGNVINWALFTVHV